MDPPLIPRPARLEPLPGADFALGPDTRLAARGEGAQGVAEWLAALLRRGTGLPLPLDDRGGEDVVELRVDPAFGEADDVAAPHLGPPSGFPDERYRLTVSATGVRLDAASAAGLFRGTQTLRQLLPPDIERGGAAPGPWTVPGVRIEDGPRFAWRGVMLDLARHFLGGDAVRRWLDLAILYKVDVLHLHLTDDQGWRIAIDGWPRLTEHGGSTQVGGGPGGWFTQAEYAELVRYAAERHVTVVPEVDLPGHMNAALASYRELGGDGPARELYTGTSVGFSSIADTPATARFLDDVFGQLAALTPGPWLHVGGDEAAATAHADYLELVTRAQRIVRAHGKRPVGWQEIAGAPLAPGAVVQYWNTRDAHAHDLARRAAGAGARLLMSPADRVYLDMKYDAATPLGLAWAGLVDARAAYGWDPAALVAGVGEEDVIGVEAALWTETIEDVGDAEDMTFPRLPGIAEVGWSAAEGRGWEEYRHRLAAHAPRWDALGVRYRRTPDVPWRAAR